MPQFTDTTPDEVLIGRQAAAREARQPYKDALLRAPAGHIDLEKDDKPAAVKRLLTESAKELGIKIRSSFNSMETRLSWRKVEPEVSSNGTATANSATAAAAKAEESKEKVASK